MKHKNLNEKQVPEKKCKDALGAALRNNLRRRKQQQRERSASENPQNAAQQEKEDRAGNLE